jgi:hypothetical protein
MATSRQLREQIAAGRWDAALAGGRIEITVPAFGKTVGNMQIKSKRHTISQPFSRNVHFYAVYYKT